MKRSYIPLEAIIPCLICVVIDSFGYNLLYPLITVMFTNPANPLLHGASSGMQGVLLGLAYMIYPLFMIFGASFMGDLSDIWGRKRVIALCMVGICVSFFFMAVGIVIKSLTFFLVGRALSGVMGGSQPVAEAAVADLSPGKSKALNMTLITLAICLGQIFGPLIGVLFTDRKIVGVVSHATPLFVSGGLTLIALVWLMMKFQETFTPIEKKKISLMEPIRLFARGMKVQMIRWLAITFLLMQVGFAIYFQTIQLVLRENFGYKSHMLLWFNLYLGVWFTLGLLFVAPWILRRFHLKSVAIWSYLLMGVFQFFTMFENLGLIWVIAIPWSVMNALAMTLSMTLFSNSANHESQGWVMGLFTATYALSFVVVGLTTNLLKLFSFSFLLFLGSAVTVVSGVILWVILNRYSRLSEVEEMSK